MVFNILMMFSRLRYRHLTASIAVIAILLLFIAPLVSKMLTEQHIGHNAMMVSATVAHHLPEQPSHQPIMMDHSMVLVGGYACGYCELLVHMPLSVAAFCFSIWLILLNIHFPLQPWVIDIIVRRVATFHSPRAPPAPGNRISLL